MIYYLHAAIFFQMFNYGYMLLIPCRMFRIHRTTPLNGYMVATGYGLCCMLLQQAIIDEKYLFLTFPPIILIMGATLIFAICNASWGFSVLMVSAGLIMHAVAVIIAAYVDAILGHHEFWVLFPRAHLDHFFYTMFGAFVLMSLFYWSIRIFDYGFLVREQSFRMNNLKFWSLFIFVSMTVALGALTGIINQHAGNPIWWIIIAIIDVIVIAVFIYQHLYDKK